MTMAPEGDRNQNIATAITEVSERASLLVKEEIELAKAEIAQKTMRIAKGAVVGAAAGVFVFTALFFFLVGCAWLLYFELPIGNQFTYFYGFFAMAVILLILGAIAGLIAAKAVKAGSPPTPDMAIEEARKIKDTVSAAQATASTAEATAGPSGTAAGAGHGPGAGQAAGAAVTSPPSASEVQPSDVGRGPAAGGAYGTAAASQGGQF